MVLIDPFKASIVHSEVFDTYISSENFNKFILREIPNGFIVVAACKDDCMTGLSIKAKEWFVKLGSEQIYDLKYQHAFTFIGVKGYTQKTSEKLGSKKSETVAV